MLQRKTGNLLTLAKNGEFDLIVHGCNCFQTMGSGIAREIREKYPESYEADCAYSYAGDYNKLGNFSICKTADGFGIVNAYTQFGFNKGGANEDVFEYISFAMILQKLAMQMPSAKFGFPYIGMGLAGGNEEKIIGLLEQFAERVAKTGGSVTLVKFQQ